MITVIAARCRSMSAACAAVNPVMMTNRRSARAAGG
jgi:hypothetical protein